MDEYPDDDLEEVEIKDVEEFSCEQTDYKPVNPIENANSSSFDWIMQPAKLWRESKSKKILEVNKVFKKRLLFLMFRLAYMMTDVKTIDWRLKVSIIVIS